MAKRRGRGQGWCDSGPGCFAAVGLGKRLCFCRCRGALNRCHSLTCSGSQCRSNNIACEQQRTASLLSDCLSASLSACLATCLSACLPFSLPGRLPVCLQPTMCLAAYAHADATQTDLDDHLEADLDLGAELWAVSRRHIPQAFFQLGVLLGPAKHAAG